jgi:hypothetical protein
MDHLRGQDLERLVDLIEDQDGCGSTQFFQCGNHEMVARIVGAAMAPSAWARHRCRSSSRSRGCSCTST